MVFPTMKLAIQIITDIDKANYGSSFGGHKWYNS